MTYDELVNRGIGKLHDRVEEWIQDAMLSVDSGVVTYQFAVLGTNIEAESKQTMDVSTDFYLPGSYLEANVSIVKDPNFTAKKVWEDRERWMKQTEVSNALWSELDQDMKELVVRQVKSNMRGISKNVTEFDGFGPEVMLFFTSKVYV